jgi:hydrogenase nickel incorporation protein HypA/HybF
VYEEKKGAAIMHEIGYALDLIEHIEKAARDAGDAKVIRVKVKLGLEKGVRPENLRMAFDWAKKDTIAEDAELEIETVPITLHCTLCDHIHVTEEVLDECPHCGALGGEILSGDEFLIESVEMEEASAFVH